MKRKRVYTTANRVGYVVILFKLLRNKRVKVGLLRQDDRQNKGVVFAAKGRGTLFDGPSAMTDARRAAAEYQRIYGAFGISHRIQAVGGHDVDYVTVK